MVRTRIAPSPTGIPHIGNTRSALFNFLFARHNAGAFILRIEDTDQKRIVTGARDAIIEILNWLGLAPDETYTQSERLDIYKKAADVLLKNGQAERDEDALRFIVPKGKTVTWQDAVGEKTISFHTDDIEDFVILKSDGFPTYHLASVIDDHDMNISHVIRGDEWISSTPKHLLLYESFGWKAPVFAHLPIILGSDKTKLSKRHGAKSVLDYRDEGYLPEALLNFMALLGWNPGENREIMDLTEMIRLFDLKDVNTNPPIFDLTKLEWMNGGYIRQVQNSKLKTQILELDPSLREIPDDVFDKLLEIAKTRMKTLREFKELVEPFLHPVSVPRGTPNVVDQIRKDLEALQSWDKQAISDVILGKYILGKKISFKDLYKRLIGEEKGLPLDATFEAIGREKTLELFSV